MLLFVLFGVGMSDAHSGYLSGNLRGFTSSRCGTECRFAQQPLISRLVKDLLCYYTTTGRKTLEKKLAAFTHKDQQSQLSNLHVRGSDGEVCAMHPMNETIPPVIGTPDDPLLHGKGYFLAGSEALV
jgi:hypothetical protein